MTFTIYGKDHCPACLQAIRYLEAKGYGYDYKKLGVDYTVEELKALFGEQTSSVPQIMLHSDIDRPIGGLAELSKFV